MSIIGSRWHIFVLDDLLAKSVQTPASSDQTRCQVAVPPFDELIWVGRLVSCNPYFAGAGDPAGLVPVVNEVEREVGGAAPTQRLPPPTPGRRTARWRGHFCLRTLAGGTPAPPWADRNVCPTFPDTLKRGLRTGEGIDGPRNTLKNAKSIRLSCLFAYFVGDFPRVDGLSLRDHFQTR
jgi:hypothetical protein